MKWNRIVFPFIVVIALWTIASHINMANESNRNMPEKNQSSIEEMPRVGFRAPSFELKALDGKSYSLTQINTPVVINFWASWCGPCRIEAPELVKMHAKYEGQVEILAINLTESDSRNGAEAFAKKYNFTFPVLLDFDGAVSRTYRVMAIPTTYFVNEHGVIADQIIGFASSQDLEDKFKKLISK